jgi:hypothetical protein
MVYTSYRHKNHFQETQTMANLTGITGVRPTSNTTFAKVPYGATISAGQPVVLSGSSYVPADANASAALAASTAIAITPGVSGGYGLIALTGSIILVGTTMVVGTTYLVSPTAGGIMPDADRVTGDYVTKLGTASSATQLDLSIVATSVAVP